jgi:integrase
MRKISQQDCKVILIAPMWSRREWYPLLLDMVISIPYPVMRDIVTQEKGRLLHHNPAELCLVAWLRSGRPSLRQAFLQDLQTPAWQQKVRLPSEHMIQAGTIFYTWCQQAGYNPTTASVDVIVAYLQDNLDEGKSISTIKTRVSSIKYLHQNPTFVGSLGSDPYVQSFMAKAHRKKPYKKDRIPIWELPWVLQGLMDDPLEPLESLDLRKLTLKTVFLVAVCSARRIGELQALDCRPTYCSVGAGGAVLKTRDGFLPKVPSLANIKKRIELAPYGLDDDGVELPEHALCVCRALTRYLEVTKSFRKTTQLFVTYGDIDQGHVATKGTLARWLREAICEGYRAVQKEPPEGLKAHTIRHASASWNYLHGTSVFEICQQMIGQHLIPS